MDKATVIKVLREVAQPGSGHLFSRRIAAGRAAAMLDAPDEAPAPVGFRTRVPGFAWVPWLTDDQEVIRTIVKNATDHGHEGEALFAGPVALAGSPSEDAEHAVTIDVRDLYAFLRAAWREGQHHDREDIPDQADSWSAASDYANKVIDKWTEVAPAGLPDEREAAPSDAAITACALVIKGTCMTKPQDEWVTKIEERIRFMLASEQGAAQ